MISLHRDAGTTLVELLVVLAILGIMTGIVGLTFAVAGDWGRDEETAALISDARSEALATGRPVTTSVVRDGARHSITAWPDGRVFADPSLAIDPLTGVGAQ